MVLTKILAIITIIWDVVTIICYIITIKCDFGTLQITLNKKKMVLSNGVIGTIIYDFVTILQKRKEKV